MNSNCKFCGLQVSWLDRRPLDQSGRDHRETCQGFSRARRDRIRDENHEAMVAHFLRGKHGKKRQDNFRSSRVDSKPGTKRVDAIQVSANKHR